ncbi:MAG: hypothetical protein WC677_03910 [Clostridia bacterium]|jgi:hypothetical protein
MFLIITGLAAVVSTIIWYVQAPKDTYKISTLCFIYWGATLMWLVDHVIANINEGGAFFEINLDATMLGVTVFLIGLLAWMIMLLVNDPKKVFRVLLKR